MPRLSHAADPLPAHGESFALLDDAARGLVAATSARRAALELEGAAAFTAVTQALIDLRADVRIVDLSARAIAEEIRHADIYRELASAYGGVELAPLRAAPIEVPTYVGVSPRQENVLRVVGMCCINETMACSFLDLCLSGVSAAPVRAGVREILEDEVRHARIGWAYLGSRDAGDEERRLVSAWLLPLLRTQWTRWRAQIASLPAFDLPAHGCPSPAAIERASLASMRGLVIPGFARAGVDVTEAQAWLSREHPPEAPPG
jgi:hypothetical protein